jgi:hypothetical protein
MDVPELGLGISFGLHLIATVAWIGGLTAVVFILLPLGHTRLDPESYAELLVASSRRLEMVGSA